MTPAGLSALPQLGGWRPADVFKGRVALVTGSARGIGRAVVETLVAGGARVMMSDLDKEAVERAANEIEGDTAVFAGDLTDRGVPESLVAATVARWGGLDIIVNNAGYMLSAAAHRMSDGDFDAMLAIHLQVPFRILRAAAPHLRRPPAQVPEDARIPKKVVNVSSMATAGMPGEVNYSAAKAGVVGLTKTLAKEWGRHGVNVNTVAFGFIETRLTKVRDKSAAIDIAGRTVPVGVPVQLRQELIRGIALGRPGRVDEAAGAVAFLCSPWSDYVTGQVLSVNGGLAASMTE